MPFDDELNTFLREKEISSLKSSKKSGIKVIKKCQIKYKLCIMYNYRLYFQQSDEEKAGDFY